MPSNINSFSDAVRTLEPDIRVDLALDGTVESQAQYLDNYTILETVDGVAGIKEMTLDAAFFVPNPSNDWSKQGRTVEADVTIYGDADNNLLSNYAFTAWTGDNPDGWTVTESGSDVVTETHDGARLVTTGALVAVSQNVLTPGVSYTAEVFVSNYVTGTLVVAQNTLGTTVGTITSAGKHTFTFTATGALFGLRRSGSMDVTVRYVILKANTSHTESLFAGSTSRQKSVPLRDIKIQATSLNSDYLDKKAARQVFVSEDIADIMQSLLEEVGVDPSDISLTSTGITLDAYVVSDNVPIREYIQDLALGALQVVGFDRDGVFTASTLTPINTSGSAFTPDITVDLDDILDFRDRDVEGRFYCNRLIGRGGSLVYLQDTQLDFTAEMSGQVIRPGQRLYVEYEIPDTVPLEIKPFAPFTGSGLGTFGYQLNSFYGFYDTDDGNGNLSNADIAVVSQSIARDDTTGKDILLLVFLNNSVNQTKYLRTLLINGSGVQKVADLYQRDDNDANIAADGKETVYEVSSNAIQSDVRLGVVMNTLKLNLWDYQNVYTFSIPGRPNISLGTKIAFKDRANNDLLGVVCEIDSEISQDRGYEQELTVKILANPASYLQLDNASTGLDDSNYQLF